MSDIGKKKVSSDLMVQNANSYDAIGKKSLSAGLIKVSGGGSNNGDWLCVTD